MNLYSTSEVYFFVDLERLLKKLFDFQNEMYLGLHGRLLSLT